ncbi:LysR family transcriptional regulator [Phaeovulum sp. W22_SRMD_FR3]|uniref:LysR family transcriptional regulator n=1 Tax=Phaeovulum sp. W22_SRMD_FR3 TaxID=3240274 RepID=UPI003F96356E
MIGPNLRHLRVFLALSSCGSATVAAARCFVSQPAVTQSIGKLEQAAGTPLFNRTPQGFFLTDAGAMLRARVARAIGLLDQALTDVSPRLTLTATRPQLLALVAASEAQNFSLAARRLGVAQPTVHRAISQLEHEAGRPLFQRTPYGITPTRRCLALARAVKLAFVELDQANAELGELAGREVGEIVIGALPLSRSHILPHALTAFRRLRPTQSISVIDGPYEELLGGLRRGEIDFLIGALRNPQPIDDVEQEALFDDTLVLLSGADHPVLRQTPLTVEALRRYPWLVPRSGTPTRAQFDLLFQRAGVPPPESIIETGSVILMREMLAESDHLACISRLQAIREIGRHLVAALPFAIEQSARPIGLTFRKGWVPTPAQNVLLDEIRKKQSGGHNL